MSSILFDLSAGWRYTTEFIDELTKDWMVFGVDFTVLTPINGAVQTVLLTYGIAIAGNVAVLQVSSRLAGGTIPFQVRLTADVRK
jgi:hypothetical protein